MFSNPACWYNDGMETPGYNERLFEGRGWRARMHQARFTWLRGALRRHDCTPVSVIELGCFDAKTLDYLPTPPERYLGLDANWEGGLDLALEGGRTRPGVELAKCTHPDHIPAGECFQVGVCMETLEHVPPNLVTPYLAALADRVSDLLLVTIPNEKGLPFAAKYLSRWLLGLKPEHYTMAEFFNAALGRMEGVVRDEHKGFDYAALLTQIKAHFEVLSVESIPFGWLPVPLSPGIGVIARPRTPCQTESAPHE